MAPPLRHHRPAQEASLPRPAPPRETLCPALYLLMPFSLKLTTFSDTCVHLVNTVTCSVGFLPEPLP